MSKQNIEVVNRLIDQVINQGNFDVIQEVVDEQYSYQAGEISFVGKEPLEHLLRAYRDAFPDIKITVLEQLASGDTVVTRGRMSGTQLGSFNELPANGREIDVDVVIFSQINNGKIVKEFEIIDELNMLRQLDVGSL
ncbi:ester cyclase [Paraglaciecola sp.]|uniref:ester cyclase n=1 Tax=Paraglaciecola sp. TaxID=1920173 RepID=UPI003263019B